MIVQYYAQVEATDIDPWCANGCGVVEVDRDGNPLVCVDEVVYRCYGEHGGFEVSPKERLMLISAFGPWFGLRDLVGALELEEGLFMCDDCEAVAECLAEQTWRGTLIDQLTAAFRSGSNDGLVVVG